MAGTPLIFPPIIPLIIPLIFPLIIPLIFPLIATARHNDHRARELPRHVLQRPLHARAAPQVPPRRVPGLGQTARGDQR